MDCKTARLLLPYLNPRAEPLPVELAGALEMHAGQWAACTSYCITLAVKIVRSPSP